jgi:hypothetical protein
MAVAVPKTPLTARGGVAWPELSSPQSTTDPIGTVGPGVGVGPAWATADQTVTASAAITRGPTTERRIIEFDTVLLLV